MDPTLIKVRVSPVNDGDIPACFDVLSASFGHDAPFVDAFYPNHDTALGRASGSRRLGLWKKMGSNSRFLKATLQEDEGRAERIVGLVIWTLMLEAPEADLATAEALDTREIWPDEGDHEFVARLWREYVVPRTQAVKDSNGKGVHVLEVLAVHPDYQRLGVGFALVNEGTKFADELGIMAVVEGTHAGRRVYEKCGFQAEIEEMTFNVGQEFSDRRKPSLIFMTRRPVPES